MGMANEIKQLEYAILLIKQNGKDYLDERDIPILETAIETMRKYQKLEQEPTTKNDLGVDCVARQDVERFIEGFINEYTPEEELEFINLELNGLKHLPSVTPQEPQTFKWCETCKEYDQEKHCCHRWSKVIRDTVEEMKQEQEPILKKIRAEIDNALSDGMIHKKTVLGIIDKYKAETENT